ncbi:MAG: hypothetical protein HRU29_14155 [Rhizobiales bacterium]|nr:hypothetical protein [Hyphomicrobiales bacterium]NRB15538.1 hypothetical protein [Hyphomicrobiales bacterium]
MSKLLIWFAAFILVNISLTGMSLAATLGTATMACTQQGIVDAGGNLKGIDGKLSNSTKKAATAYLKNNDTALPELSIETAAEWCKELGAMVAVVDLDIPDIRNNTIVHVIFFHYLGDIVKLFRNGIIDGQKYNEFRWLLVGDTPRMVAILTFEKIVESKQEDNPLYAICLNLAPEAKWRNVDIERDGFICTEFKEEGIYESNDEGLHLIGFPVEKR